MPDIIPRRSRFCDIFELRNPTQISQLSPLPLSIAKMLYNLPKDFYQQLTSKYEEAIENGHMKFNGESATHEVIHEKFDNSTIDVQLTHLPSLIHRPDKGDQTKNVFAEPEPELTIIDSYGPEDEFRIVFNKYPVVAKHFMIITKEYKPQTTPLSTNELIGSYTILNHLKNLNLDENWFAFYNCGEASGASQPHKHIQFMTLPKNFETYAEKLANTSTPFIPSVRDEPLQNGDLPFAHFVARLPDNASDLNEDDLTMYFVSLLQRALTVLRENDSNSISYNVILTTKYMMIVPRANGCYKDLGVNSCGILGLLLCKNEELFNLVKTDGPAEIFKSVGFPNTSGQKSDEYHY